MSKQLAQNCYPMELWRDPGIEPGSRSSKSKCANHYAIEPHDAVRYCRSEPTARCVYLALQSCQTLFWLNGVVVSVLGIRTRGPRFDARVAPLFQHKVTELRNRGRCLAPKIHYLFITSVTYCVIYSD